MINVLLYDVSLDDVQTRKYELLTITLNIAIWMYETYSCTHLNGAGVLKVQL